MGIKLRILLYVLCIMALFITIMSAVSGITINQCTPQEVRMFSDCLGMTWWDWYYMDYCIVHDYNQDGVINLVDAGIFTSGCYA